MPYVSIILIYGNVCGTHTCELLTCILINFSIFFFKHEFISMLLDDFFLFFFLVRSHFSWSFMCTFEQVLILELTKEIAIKWGDFWLPTCNFLVKMTQYILALWGTQTNTYSILGSSQCTKQFNIQISTIFAIQTWPWEMNLKAFISNLNLMSSCNIFCILSPLYSICD